MASDSLNSMLKAARGTGEPNLNDLINAVMRGDDETAEQLFALVDEQPPSAFRGYPVSIATWAGDFSMAERTARSQARATNAHETRLSGHLNLARLFVARGQWHAADEQLGRASDLDPERARLTRAVLATLPFLPVPHDDLASVLEELQQWMPPAPEQGAPPERAYDQHLRMYFLGLLSSKLGDTAAAFEYADSIETLDDFAATAVPAELATTIRADAAWRDGSSPADVLRALEPLRGHVPAVFWSHPAFGQEHARYLRASALYLAGESDEALRWLENTFTVTPGWVYYLGPVGYLTAQVLDASGRVEEAAGAHATYGELWADADAEVQFPEG